MNQLQIRSHKEIFDSRKNAIDYINLNFKLQSLIGEPAVAYYGDVDNPNMILAIGLGNGKIGLIDIDDTNEKVAKLINDSDLNKEDITKINSNISDLIESCGLNLDDNKVKFKITYNPGDELVSSAKSLSEAIDILCGEVKKNKSEFNLEAKNSDTITFKLAPNSSGNGKTLTGSINLSDDNSIVYSKANNGIKANIDITCTEDNAKNNLLSVKIGNLTKLVELPGLNIIKEIKYNPKNKTLVVSANNGGHIDINVADMVQTWIIDSDNNKGPVVLHRENNSVLGEPDKVYAELKLSPTDNLIEKDITGNILVKGEKIKAISKEITDTSVSKLETKLNSSLETKAEKKDLELETNRAKLAETTLTNNLEDEINRIEHDIELNKLKYYTISETDGKFSTKLYSDDKFATKTNLNNVNTKVDKAIDSINLINANIGKYDLKPGETNSIRNTITNNIIKSDLKLSNNRNNIIKNTDNGIYAQADLTYNEINRTITFNNGVCTGIEIPLNDGIKDLIYLSDSKELVYKSYDICDKIYKEHRLDLCELFNKFNVKRNPDSPVELVKETIECTDECGTSNIDLLSAKFHLADNVDNLLKIVNGALYASSMASEHYTLWNEDSCNPNEKMTVQDALNLLLERVKGSEVNYDDLLELKKLVNNINLRLGEKTDVADANGSAFARIAKIVDELIRIEQEITGEIGELNYDDIAIKNNYVTSVSQENGLINVTREHLPISGIVSDEKIISSLDNNLKTTLKISIDDGIQADGERYLRLKGINDQLIDKVGLSGLQEYTIDCGEY